GVQAGEEALDDELGAEVEPADLADHLGAQVFLSAHAVTSWNRGPLPQPPLRFGEGEKSNSVGLAPPFRVGEGVGGRGCGSTGLTSPLSFCRTAAAATSAAP